jgi:ABC-type methionine transport system ATPase subunit
MASVKKQVYCTFPKEQIREPIVYNLCHQFQVVPNIRGATINEQMGIVFLDLEGEAAEVDKAIAYLKSKNVRVDTVAT